MRTLSRVAVSSAVLGIAMMSGQGVASAQVIPNLDITIRLDSSAPSTGDLVSGIRQIDGFAEALEGVRRIDLYVMPAGITRSVDSAVPVDSMTSDVPLNRASFDLEWDTTAMSGRLVDIIVVARSATRTGQLEIPTVRVAQAAPKSTTAAAGKSSGTAKPAGSAAAVTRAAAAPPARPAAAAAARAQTASVKGVRFSSPAADEPAVSAAQAASFYKVYGQLPYTAQGAPATPSVITRAAETTRGPWPYIAAGMVLMVTAGHVQRSIRVPLARRP